MSQRIGIVVPTLGERPDYLKLCLKSIRSAGEAHICLVSPQINYLSELIKDDLVDQFESDPGVGLAQAINWGISALPENVQFISWLADDDLLMPGSLDRAAETLSSEESILLVFGSCDYIDHEGKVLFTNKSGTWAVPLLRFGPDLIPQPGSLFKRSAFQKVGGLDLKFSLAFDFDFLIKISKIGKIKFINTRLASFRWHSNSMTVKHRSLSASEASKVRISHLPIILKPISFIWEIPVKWLTSEVANSVIAGAKFWAMRK